MNDNAGQEQQWLRQYPGQEREWFRLRSLIYGAFVVVGVYMAQPFLVAALLDLSASICPP
jgi:hypothetical protein